MTFSRIAAVPFVPALSARALGAFRITLAGGLIAVVASAPMRVIPLSEQRHYAVIDWPLIHSLAASPEGILAVRVAAIVAALLFGVGLFTRWAFAAFVATFLVLTLIVLEWRGAHDLGLPFITLAGWLTVPWGVGLSVDRWLRPRQRPAVVDGEPTEAYGFAIWWPALTLGLALLAAAYAKLAVSGLAWMTGGAVKYHFVTDYAGAPVEWGLWIAAQPMLAMLLSFGAIALEGGFILLILVKRPMPRLLGLVAGGVLFTGLYLFQGIFWMGWVVMLAAFLPWGALDRQLDTRAGSASLTSAQVLAIILAISVQAYATARGIEGEPLLSNFPMYSGTWESTTQFDRDMDWRFTRVSATRGDGVDAQPVFAALNIDERIMLVRMAAQFANGSASLNSEQQRGLKRACEDYARLAGAVPEKLDLRFERRAFDWDRGAFTPYRPVPTAPIPLATLCSGP